jgi:hypothetical protein
VVDGHDEVIEPHARADVGRRSHHFIAR